MHIETQLALQIKKQVNASRILEKIDHNIQAKEQARFMYNAGLHRDLIVLACSLIKKDEPVPWVFVIKVLLDNNVTLPASFNKLLFTHFISKLSPSFISLQTWSFSKFKSAFENELSKIQSQVSKEIKNLLDKLNFAQAQHLPKEQEKIIDQLLTFQPKSPYFQYLKKNLKVAEVLEVLDKQKQTQKPSSKEVFYDSSKHIPKKLKETLISICQSPSPHPKHKAIFMYQTGLLTEALKILESLDDSLETAWLYLDWLMEARRYAQVLDISEKLIKHLDTNSDNLFAVTYIQAQALYKLNDKTKARAYMKSICTSRPDYKDASTLLQLWDEE